MVPIPVSILCHSATLQNAAQNQYRDLTYTKAYDLTKIRVEPSSKQIITKTGAQKQLALVLFYDCVSSKPKKVTFTVGQYVLYNGAEYRIEMVDELHDNRKLHHYEVGLSG